MVKLLRENLELETNLKEFERKSDEKKTENLKFFIVYKVFKKRVLEQKQEAKPDLLSQPLSKSPHDQSQISHQI